MLWRLRFCQRAIKQAEEAGLAQRAQILRDVTDYHAHTRDISAAATKAKVKQLAFYPPGTPTSQRGDGRGIYGRRARGRNPD